MFENLHPVTVSVRAAEEIIKIMKTKNIPHGYGLRLGVRGGGCAGVSLIIGFDHRKDHDLTYTIRDIPVFIDKRHTLYLIGKEVDYYDGDNTSGFVFRDPAVASTPL